MGAGPFGLALFFIYKCNSIEEVLNSVFHGLHLCHYRFQNRHYNRHILRIRQEAL